MVLLKAKLRTWLLDSIELTVPAGDIKSGFSGDLWTRSRSGPQVLLDELGTVGMLGARGGMGGREADACTRWSAGVVGENEGIECSLGEAIGERILKLSEEMALSMLLLILFRS